MTRGELSMICERCDFHVVHFSGHGGVVHPDRLDEPTQPVVRVTWEDAARYLNWLSEKDGLPPAYAEKGETFEPVRPPTTGYRLPTEAEWALVARHAGASPPRKYAWGETFPPTLKRRSSQ